MTTKLSIRQPNAITNARYSYTKNEKNVVYQVIVALNYEMEAGNMSADLFDRHFCLTIPYNQLKKWDMNDNMSRDLKSAVRSLRKKDYDIKTDNGWIDTGFIVYAEYSEKKGLYVEVSKALLPALVDLQRNFTAYNAVVAMSLQSKYAQRFYEWCCRWRDTGWFEFTPDQLNDILKTDMATGALKERVIETARKELEDLFILTQNDVYFEVEEDRSGRGRGGSVNKWRFLVKTREMDDKKKEILSEDYAFVVNVLKSAWPGKVELINKAAELILTSKCVNSVAERFGKIEKRKVTNMGGYIRNLLTQEFNLPL